MEGSNYYAVMHALTKAGAASFVIFQRVRVFSIDGAQTTPPEVDYAASLFF
jgi:hypothetical protein